MQARGLRCSARIQSADVARALVADDYSLAAGLPDAGTEWIDAEQLDQATDEATTDTTARTDGGATTSTAAEAENDMQGRQRPTG